MHAFSYIMNNNLKFYFNKKQHYFVYYIQNIFIKDVHANKGF